MGTPRALLHAISEEVTLAVASTMIPGHAEAGATAAQARGLRLHRAGGRDHRNRVGIWIARDRDPIRHAIAEADRPEIGERQHATRARGRFGNPLSRATLSLPGGLVGAKRPAPGGI